MKLFKILLLWLVFCGITFIFPVSALVGGIAVMIYAITKSLQCKPFRGGGS